MKYYTLGFAFADLTNQVLLIEKQNPPEQRGFYNGIGGKFEKDDPSFKHTMVREFQEETSVLTSIDDWIFKGTLESPNWVVFVYSISLLPHEWEQAKTTTIEKISKVEISDIFNDNVKVLDNIKSLVALCLNEASMTFKLNY
jgi:8-oxo-dGTP pyrophosphatase MutT (NUDIX family)